MKPIALYTVGIPGSGKTTWANEVRAYSADDRIKTVCLDDLRRMFDGNNYRFTNKNEYLVKHIQNMMVKEMLFEGNSVVIHNTHLKKKSLYVWPDFEAYLVSFLEVDTSLCLERNKNRAWPYVVPDHVMEGMVKNAAKVDLSGYGLEVLTPTQAQDMLVEKIYA